MTRRNFLKRIFTACIGAAVGSWVFTRKAVKKFIRAENCENYPGPIKKLKDIDHIDKWSG